MSFLGDAALVGLGYTISEVSKSNPVKDAINSAFGKDESLETVIDNWARRHGITGYDQSLYRKLLNIAEAYRDPYDF